MTSATLSKAPMDRDTELAHLAIAEKAVVDGEPHMGTALVQRWLIYLKKSSDLYWQTVVMGQCALLRESKMIKLIAGAAFALLVATSVQAMTLAPIPQPDSMITQVREGCGLGQVLVNGVCQSRAGMRQERRANRRCARYSGGACVQ